MLAEVLFRYTEGEFFLTGWGLVAFIFLMMTIGSIGRG